MPSPPVLLSPATPSACFLNSGHCQVARPTLSLWQTLIHPSKPSCNTPFLHAGISDSPRRASTSLWALVTLNPLWSGPDSLGVHSIPAHWAQFWHLPGYDTAQCELYSGPRGPLGPAASIPADSDPTQATGLCVGPPSLRSGAWGPRVTEQGWGQV